MLVAEDIKHTGLDDEMTALDGWQLKPSGDQHSEHVAVGKEDHIILDVFQAFDDPIAPLGDLIGGLSSGCRVHEDSPGGIGLPDLLGGNSLILAVVPLREILGGLGTVEESGKFTGPLCTLARAAKDELEIPVGEFRFQRGRLTFPLKGEGNVAEGGVLAFFAPLGFTVADEDDLGA